MKTTKLMMGVLIVALLQLSLVTASVSITQAASIAAKENNGPGELVYVRGEHVNMQSGERLPAWKASFENLNGQPTHMFISKETGEVLQPHANRHAYKPALF
ncbi:hypothetical protein GOV07_03590 [Candidatus Woesearchaeota archaeon]|nr:hypothetical protein [Candidatus Woesearchaeota archaeon]